MTAPPTNRRRGKVRSVEQLRRRVRLEKACAAIREAREAESPEPSPEEEREPQRRAAAVEQRRPPQKASAPLKRPKVERWTRQEPERPSMDNQALDDPVDDIGRDDGKGKRRQS